MVNISKTYHFFSVIRSAKSDLGGKVICPNCGENFMPDSELKLSVEDTENLLKAAEQENKTIEKTISKLEAKKDKFNDEIEEYEEKKAQIEEYEDKIKRLNRKKKDSLT